MGKRFHSFATSTCGGVLMEYVLIMFLVLLPLLGVSNFLYNPDGKAPMIVPLPEGDDEDRFGYAGNYYVRQTRKIISVICLPIP